MNVTDEMVESALNHFYNYSPFNGPDELKAGMRRCIEAAISHAAGQEAEFPECSGDPTDCPENEGHGCCKLKKGWCEKHSRHEPCESCTDKAQPSTSAEVGRDWRPAFEAWAIGYGMNIDRAKDHPVWIDGVYVNLDTQHAHRTWEAAMAASSGRQD